MTTRFTAAALALALSLSAGGAFAQSYTAPAGIPADTSVAASASPLAVQGYRQAYPDRSAFEPATTGSVRHHGTRRHAR